MPKPNHQPLPLNLQEVTLEYLNPEEEADRPEEPIRPSSCQDILGSIRFVHMGFRRRSEFCEAGNRLAFMCCLIDVACCLCINYLIANVITYVHNARLRIQARDNQVVADFFLDNPDERKNRLSNRFFIGLQAEREAPEEQRMEDSNDHQQFRNIQ